MFGAEMWVWAKADIGRLMAAEMRFLRTAKRARIRKKILQTI
jgi:hypothetical protein